MALRDFHCLDCDENYDEFVNFDEKGEYPDVECPKCHSKKKQSIFTASCSFNFVNPQGTDRWNNSHDYRYKHNIPKVIEERANAEKNSHMGGTPQIYQGIDDINSGKHFGEVK
jgi:DNA-directed RNA polymerase subunit RPC12/RpoP